MFSWIRAARVQLARGRTDTAGRQVAVPRAAARRRLGCVALGACCAVITCLGASVATASAEPYPGAPTPTVEGPIAETGSSHIFMRTKIPLAEYGYTEEEYFLSGTGYEYKTTGAVTETGSKILTGGPNSNGTYPFKTRIVVRRPINPEDFNGKVLTEWQNVTAGYRPRTGVGWGPVRADESRLCVCGRRRAAGRNRRL